MADCPEPQAPDAEIADASDESGTSSSSGDDDVEVHVDPADMESMIKLEADLEANPNLYDSHIKVHVCS